MENTMILANATEGTMIEVMPESEGNLLVFRITEKLNDDDYMSVLVPKWEELAKKYGKGRVLVHIDESYRGIDLKVLWHDAKFGVKHRRDFTKMALVGGPKWLETVAKMSACMMPGEVRTFPESQLQEALGWVKG